MKEFPFDIGSSEIFMNANFPRGSWIALLNFTSFTNNKVFLGLTKKVAVFGD
jgi:hypothetical protein